MEELISRTVGPTVQLKVELNATSSTCLVDPAQVENSLLNLCIKARDALEGEGSISIKTYNEELALGAELDPELAPEPISRSVFPTTVSV